MQALTGTLRQLPSVLRTITVRVDRLRRSTRFPTQVVRCRFPGPETVVSRGKRKQG